MTGVRERIGFAGGASWGAYSQPEMTRWAKRPDLSPRAVRVLLAAMGRHDRNGHAAFAPGELAEWLGAVDKRTGELRPAAAPAVSDAIAAAKHLGLIADASTARCLVLPPQAFQKARGACAPCTVHG